MLTEPDFCPMVGSLWASSCLLPPRSCSAASSAPVAWTTLGILKRVLSLRKSYDGLPSRRPAVLYGVLYGLALDSLLPDDLFTSNYWRIVLCCWWMVTSARDG